ncbi:MAG: thioredoxin domain-containing protein [Parabacteroides sp.]|nr:thioredoxin domain-containing protein [Parabacteroides sp.]
MEIIELTKTAFIDKIGNFETTDWKYMGDKPCIVDFSAPWCGFCKRLDPILAEFAQAYDGQLYIYKVNVDNEEDLEKAFNIHTIPTLLLCRMDGTQEMMLGTMGKAELKKIIDEKVL